MHKFIKAILSFFDFSSFEEKRIEKYLSQATDLADLEHRQKMIERQGTYVTRYY